MKVATALIGALALAALPAAAAAPPPTKAISASFYSGLWYEVARTPNNTQKDCQAPTSEFSPAKGGKYLMTQTCRRGSPAGPTKVWKAEGSIVPGSGNAKFKAKFFGLVSQEYWILDTAGDNSWAIMATPGGNYVWLMSRKAVMSSASRATALGRIKALGYNTGVLVIPQQPPA